MLCNVGADAGVGEPYGVLHLRALCKHLLAHALQSRHARGPAVSALLEPASTWLVVFQGFSESISPSSSLMTLLPRYFSDLPEEQGREALSQHRTV